MSQRRHSRGPCDPRDLPARRLVGRALGVRRGSRTSGRRTSGNAGGACGSLGPGPDRHAHDPRGRGPIPSAPVALAAGAAYGHVWGTVQVVIGAELGALIAFGLARVLGHDVLRRVFGDRVDAGLLGSQSALTATVFASRLMPFVSSDMISYAAGLSRLHAWRFALAALAGVIPASFLLAHFGGEAVSGDLGRATWAVLGLGLVTELPLLWFATRRKTEKES